MLAGFRMCGWALVPLPFMHMCKFCAQRGLAPRLAHCQGLALLLCMLLQGLET